MKVLSSQMLLEILNQNSLTLEGRSHKISLRSGRIAQLGERRPYKPEVAGSSPVPPTKGWEVVPYKPRESTYYVDWDCGIRIEEFKSKSAIYNLK